MTVKLVAPPGTKVTVSESVIPTALIVTSVRSLASATVELKVAVAWPLALVVDQVDKVSPVPPTLITMFGSTMPGIGLL